MSYLQKLPGKDTDLGDGEDGITIYLKINYKVVLLVLVVFDLLHLSLREFFFR